MVLILHEAVFAAAGVTAPKVYAMAVFLYVPLILSYLELAAGKPGSASAYQIAHAYKSSGLTFTVGWLMLAGLISVAALLTVAVAERLDVWLGSLFEIDASDAWLVVAVVVLAALSEWYKDIDPWRMRTALVGAATMVAVGMVIWGLIAHPPGGELTQGRLFGHDMTAVALLAAGLWGIDLLMNHRRQMRRPDVTLRSAALIVWATAGVLGIATTALAARSPEIWLADWSEKLSWGESRLEILGLAVSTTFCWLGLSRVVARSVRLTGAMAHDGFLPRIALSRRLKRTRALSILVLFAVLVVAVGWWVPGGLLIAMASLSFLWVTVCVMVPYARRPAKELAPTRRNRLPLHPLFPGFSAAAAAFLAWVLPLRVAVVAIGWLVLGAIYYRMYARKKSAEVLQDEAVVGVGIEERVKNKPRVMIGTERDDDLAALVKSGMALARAAEGELMVLRVLPLTDELSLHSAQARAEDEWATLERRIRALESSDAQVQLAVRIAPSVESGIVATANEYDADLIVMAAPTATRDDVASTVAGVFSTTSRAVAILRGDYPDAGARFTVATGGGPHSLEGLRLGAWLSDGVGGGLELVSVSLSSASDEEAKEAIRRTLEEAELAREVPVRVIEAKSVEHGLIEEGDLLIVGSSIDRLLGQTVFGGLPMEVAEARQGATLIVKRAEGAMRFWQRRLWELFSKILPTLSVRERTEVYAQMADDARADVDFYTLISLSSAIALLGLLLDSGAVIIGAMLVAPLMSPILSLAQGIVQGNPHLIQRSGTSIFKGTVLAIGVSTALTLLLPAVQPTREILARVNPNLLDLGVALAAGAAAAYAVSRKSVAAALPGVAISVALVPPLCVVGYGLGMSDFDIAGGALLLYLTNLAGIVLVGVVVFLLVGFRPTRVERGLQARRAAFVAAAGLVLIAVPLGLSTFNIVREQTLRSEIHATLQRLDARVFNAEKYSISKEGGRFVITGTVYAYQEIEPGRVEDVQRQLSRAVGVPIELRVTIVPASLTVVGGPPRQKTEEAPSKKEPQVVPSTESDPLNESSGEKAIEVSPPESSGKS